jgi:hypothetical protein
VTGIESCPLHDEMNAGRLAFVINELLPKKRSLSVHFLPHLTSTSP